MECFKIENLSFTYPQRENKALDNISLVINKGDYIALCGKSGCGKTTLLNQLKAVLTPHGKTDGRVIFCGQELTKVDSRTQAQKIGFVMQNPDSQIVTDKVWHELAFGLENLGVEQKTIRLRVAEMANYFGIESWFHKNVFELSGGQKQLLNLAAIMAMQPEVIILDEPTSQLDPIAAADFLSTVKKINRELGTTIIISEHRLEDVLCSADMVVVMESGRVKAMDSPRKIGGLLAMEKSEMFSAMPSPVRIFYGVNGQGNCPLTVREGRSWLSESLSDTKITVNTTGSSKSNCEEKPVAVRIKEAWFRYEKNGRDILKGLSLEVPKGELFAIVGGNGAGKSTMLKAICGFCKPYSGKIIINGKETNKYKGGELFKGNLAMLPQDPLSLFVHKTLLEDLEEMVDSRVENRAELIKETGELTEIQNLLSFNPFDLSGGEKQRGALAKILLLNPQILLLDEPTKGIDGFFKEKLADILKKLTARGITIIMVSHDIEFCAKYADSVSMFFDGSILTTAEPRQFFGGNSFYTTAANRMSRHIFENAITDEDVIDLWVKNQSLGH